MVEKVCILGILVLMVMKVVRVMEVMVGLEVMRGMEMILRVKVMEKTVCTLVLIMTRVTMTGCILVVDPRKIWETSILLTRQAMIILMNMIQEKKTNLFNIFHRFLSFMIVYDCTIIP